MFPKRLLIAVFVFLAGAFGSASAQTAPQCFTSPNPMTFAYQSGSITITYQVCTSVSNTVPPTSTSYWQSTMTYNNVSFDGGFTINGSMSMQLNFSGGSDFSITSVAFSGGPLTYNIGGQIYTVTFNNLSFSLNNAFQVGAPSGSLTINGVEVPAATDYFAYLFRAG